MVKKRNSGQYPSLFEFDSDPALVPETAVTNATEGDQHAVQNNGLGTSEGKYGSVRTTATDAPPTADAGNLRPGTEGQPRDLEAKIHGGNAEQGAEPDRERSPGNGAQGT